MYTLQVVYEIFLEIPERDKNTIANFKRQRNNSFLTITGKQ